MYLGRKTKDNPDRLFNQRYLTKREIIILKQETFKINTPFQDFEMTYVNFNSPKRIMDAMILKI
jgi:hypothetical protein